MSSRLNQVVRGLRGLILRGDLKAGERVTETAAAEMLGVSRTPVRLALSILEHENLVEGETNKGYRVREFTVTEYEDTLAVRATMDGMAARLAAENGLNPIFEEALDGVIAACDILIQKPQFESDDLQIYAKWNAVFHETIATASANISLERFLEREMPLRFRSARHVFPLHPARARDMICRSQEEHVEILDAIKSGEGMRADYLMQEHVKAPHRRAKSIVEETGGSLSHDSVLIVAAASPSQSPPRSGQFPSTGENPPVDDIHRFTEVGNK